MKLDRIKEILLQVKEGLETIDSASLLIHTNMKELYVMGRRKGKEEFNKEDIPTDELISLIQNMDEMTWFTERQINELEQIIINHKGNRDLMANNLHDEQKLELFADAMNRFTLQELESKLA